MKIAGFLCLSLWPESLRLKKVDPDDIRPFPQPPANTISEKAAIKFKPMLNISYDGCVPYPAVSKDGSYVEDFFEASKSVNYCKGNQHGSQIYGRATWYNNRFTKYSPPNETTVDGTHVKVRYILPNDWDSVGYQLNTTDLKGGFQDLILWQQLTDEARCALNQMSWGNRQMPINENNFQTTLKEAYPFK
ncbi:unnamed protein product [Peronospora farinosa]|uniref:Uncharacterized protein n=1 Tax=Peronospora farinosa TaxID=134698 RepID=A0AAV0TTE3_9STRA|nr:unnamed protein product [Peronospora farinosa]